MTGFHFASGSNVFSAVGLDCQYWRITFKKASPDTVDIRGIYLFDDSDNWVNELAGSGYLPPATEIGYSPLAEGQYRFYHSSATNIAVQSFANENQQANALKQAFSVRGNNMNLCPKLSSPVLDEMNSDSWLSVEFALSNVHERVTGYNLRYHVKYMTSWDVYASNDGESWNLVDSRANQERAQSGNGRAMSGEEYLQYNLTAKPNYYTFGNVRVDGLAQTHPLSLQVDSGAAADLRAYTGGCVVSNLTIVADGASDGVIYGAKLAASGTLNVLLPSGTLPDRLPLRLPDVLDSGNLRNWQVIVNGEASRARFCVLDGDVMRERKGFMVIVL